jgi:hypothetical protein
MMSGAQLDESQMDHLTLRQKKGKPIVAERTRLLNPVAIESYGNMGMDASSCSACFAYVWNYKMLGNSTMKEAYGSCNFRNDLLNGACVWVHTSGLPPRALAGIVSLTGKEQKGSTLHAKASNICQSARKVDGGLKYPMQIPKICPSFMNDAAQIRAGLGIFRCRCTGKTLEYAFTGDRLCRSDGTSTQDLMKSLLGSGDATKC